MWGKAPFSIGDNYAINVRNLPAAREWYKEKLGLRESQDVREEDSGRPFVDLNFSDNSGLLSLLELAPSGSADREHVILFAKNLEKAHQWLAGRDVSVESITTDTGGNRLFRFQDLDGNTIEVCVEPD